MPAGVASRQASLSKQRAGRSLTPVLTVVPRISCVPIGLIHRTITSWQFRHLNSPIRRVNALHRACFHFLKNKLPSPLSAFLGSPARGILFTVPSDDGISLLTDTQLFLSSWCPRGWAPSQLTLTFGKCLFDDVHMHGPAGLGRSSTAAMETHNK